MQGGTYKLGNRARGPQGVRDNEKIMAPRRVCLSMWPGHPWGFSQDSFRSPNHFHTTTKTCVFHFYILMNLQWGFIAHDIKTDLIQKQMRIHLPSFNQMFKRFKKCKTILLFSLNLFLLGKYSNFPDVEIDDKMCLYL